MPLITDVVMVKAKRLELGSERASVGTIGTWWIVVGTLWNSADG